MKHIKLIGEGNIDQVITFLDNEMQETSDFVYKVEKTIHDEKIYVMVYECYYFRVKNRVSLTIVIYHEQEKIIVEGIASGGSNSFLTSFDLGASSSFVKRIYEILEPLKFTLVEPVNL